MSLNLKDRRVYFERSPRYSGKKEIITGKISPAPIWLSVITDTGGICAVEEKNLHFDLKKKGRGR